MCFHVSFHVKSLIRLFTIDSLTSIVGASWFVIMLFWVSVSYNILDNLCSLERKLHDYAFLLVSMLLGIIALELCMAKYNHYLPYLFVLGTVWYIQFYHMGRLFHRYWECHVRNLNTLYTCMGCVGVNVLLICMVGDHINFYATAGMGSFHSSILPIITSFTGILFWYKVMQYLSEKLGGYTLSIILQRTLLQLWNAILSLLICRISMRIINIYMEMCYMQIFRSQNLLVVPG